MELSTAISTFLRLEEQLEAARRALKEVEERDERQTHREDVGYGAGPTRSAGTLPLATPLAPQIWKWQPQTHTHDTIHTRIHDHALQRPQIPAKPAVAAAPVSRRGPSRPRKNVERQTACK
jgi:hypothetical protein